MPVVKKAVAAVKSAAAPRKAATKPATPVAAKKVAPAKASPNRLADGTPVRAVRPSRKPKTVEPGSDNLTLWGTDTLIADAKKAWIDSLAGTTWADQMASLRRKTFYWARTDKPVHTSATGGGAVLRKGTWFLAYDDAQVTWYVDVNGRTVALSTDGFSFFND